MINTQRGISYDPRQAKSDRIVLEAKIRQDTMRQLKKLEHQQEMRAYGRKLDQVERCYREYQPIQAR